MFLDDYNEETFKREVRAEAFMEGYKEGVKEAINEAHVRVATDMIMKGIFPVPVISEISHLPEDTIREMAAKLNVKL